MPAQRLKSSGRRLTIFGGRSLGIFVGRASRSRSSSSSSATKGSALGSDHGIRRLAGARLGLETEDQQDSTGRCCGSATMRCPSPCTLPGGRGFEARLSRGKEKGRARAPPVHTRYRRGYCLSYTAVLFIDGSEPFVTTVRDLPSDERLTVPVTTVLPPFFMFMLSE